MLQVLAQREWRVLGQQSLWLPRWLVVVNPLHEKVAMRGAALVLEDRLDLVARSAVYRAKLLGRRWPRGGTPTAAIWNVSRSGPRAQGSRWHRSVGA